MGKYEKEIKKNLKNLFGEKEASNIFEINFPKQTKEQKKKEELTYLLEKAASGENLTKLQAKKLQKMLGQTFRH